MKYENENGLFLFHRDLRIHDNIGLNELTKICKNIYTIFIFTPEQITSNKYKSDSSVQFMINSLIELNEEIMSVGGKLHFYYGNTNKVIANCIKCFKINCIAFNKDITPYSISRDKDIEIICKKQNVKLIQSNDYYLTEPGEIVTTSNESYRKFTPYYNAVIKKKILKPQTLKAHFVKFSSQCMYHTTIKEMIKKISINNNLLVNGGRTEAIKLLNQASKNLNKYDKTRNILSENTSKLSASIKFGCISIRETYYKLIHNKDLIRQLIWRDFYANIMLNYPHVLGNSMVEKYNKIKWNHNLKWFKLWCEGKTGFPIVDASIRQLLETGYMHNRGRLIVASFLVKTLLINWQKGEQFFASKLTDYDPASNNGNWQWCAGTGVDSQPYFRFFNPWNQTKEHDPDCIFIKKWIPELKNVENKDILNWNESWIKYPNIKYPKPIVDFNEQREKALKMYKV